MGRFPKKLTAIAPALAMVAGSGAAGSHAANATASDTRALALNVVESGNTVEIELIANSPVTQQVEYAVELSGASNARHRGSTSIAAGDRQVLSRMKTSASKGWCATVEVNEASGARYTLTAGDCTGI
jgi:hypothetical protein